VKEKGAAKAAAVKEKEAAKARQMRECSYELQRQENITRNEALYQKIRDKNPKYATPPKKRPQPRPRKPKPNPLEVTQHRSQRVTGPSSASASIVPPLPSNAALPLWLSDAITLLEAISGPTDWMDLIGGLLRLDEALGFPSGKVSFRLLITTSDKLIELVLAV
jgi:hypothetical protein